MPKGLKLPIQVGPHGGVAIVEGEEQLQKIIMLNLSDLTNENPFQQWRGASHGEPGIDMAIVFAQNTTYLKARIKRNIKALFERLEADERAKLVDGYPVITEDSSTQELTAKIKYINLETDKPDEFEQKYSLEGKS